MGRKAACRTAEELALMRRAGRVVATMHAEIRSAIKPGVTTAELDRIGRTVLADGGATSNFLGYHGYPAVICASPNDMIVHGIPSEDVILCDGDLLSIDCGAIVEGYHGDAAFTVGVGAVSDLDARLLDVGEAALAAGIEQLVPGNRLGDVGFAIQAVIEASGFSVVREYVGHAIGTAMHEEPQVPNYGKRGSGRMIEVGNVYCLEPMLNVGAPDTFLLEDGWSVVTNDGSRSAHFEHSIAVTSNGPDILTR